MIKVKLAHKIIIYFGNKTKSIFKAWYVMFIIVVQIAEFSFILFRAVNT